MSNRISIATISLHNMAGGLERNIIYLANFLANTGFDVQLISFDLPKAQSFYAIDVKVSWVKLGVSQPHMKITWKERIRLIARIRSALKIFSADKLICFHHGIILRFILATFLLDVKIICSERNSLDLYKFIKLRKWNIQFFMLMFVHRITVQFERYKNDYPYYLQSRIVTIHNPVQESNLSTKLNRKKNILSIGRLSTQKQFDFLIQSFSVFNKLHRDWTLTIVGDGPDKNKLEALAKNLKVKDKIHFVSPKHDITSYFEGARIYCQTSQWEGFPNALAEAMAAGAIPVGLKKTAGVSDLVNDGHNGYLVEDKKIDKFAKKLTEVVCNDTAWAKVSLNAREVSNLYSVENWQTSWLRVLSDEK